MAADPERSTIVHLTGEVDLAAADEIIGTVQQALDEADSAGDGPLVLDLAGVTFMDSTGLGALISIRARAEAAGRSLTLRQVPARVRRLLEITGLTSTFGLE